MTLSRALKPLKNNKAQTSLEYLLTISVAVMLAAIVFTIALQTGQIVSWVQDQIQTFRQNAILAAAE
ncbi:MAG: hypothetical protein GOV15_03395 [Candidatus Diapherotrites archaeon]|nr:hypothetical protein [Candidatus Diapherotrites archaeon]